MPPVRDIIKTVNHDPARTFRLSADPSMMPHERRPVMLQMPWKTKGIVLTAPQPYKKEVQDVAEFI